MTSKRSPKRPLQVKEVAALSGVSVRALHHYDEIGLLVPSQRSDAGYRLYTADDVFRLQQITVGRTLGLSLDEIRRSLDDPGFDRRAALEQQRDLLRRRLSDTAAMIASIDHALAVIDGTGDPMTASLFDGFDPAAHDDEARARWGHTDSHRESQRRTKAYTKADWERHREESAAVYRDLAAARDAGKEPFHDDVVDLADRHRLLIDRWFYPCSIDRHEGLAGLYEADERFAANIDRFGAGLTAYVVAAIRANAARYRVGP